MSFKEQVITTIKSVPRGKVATYGQIAGLCGSPRAAITVGQILHRSTEAENLPWQRVINGQGRISVTCLEHPAQLQAALLKADGVEVVAKGDSLLVNLEKYLWRP